MQVDCLALQWPLLDPFPFSRMQFSSQYISKYLSHARSQVQENKLAPLNTNLWNLLPCLCICFCPHSMGSTQAPLSLYTSVYYLCPECSFHWHGLLFFYGSVTACGPGGTKTSPAQDTRGRRRTLDRSMKKCTTQGKRKAEDVIHLFTSLTLSLL